ncbi:MAG: hypothetical protein C0465_24400 [Ralstonia sp.]|nr:hypothetical protein [Ralstonia sp.]
MLAAMKAAQAGDDIKIYPGSYSNIYLSGIVKSGNVTISSVDQNNPAVLYGLSVNSSSGFTFSGLEMVSRRDSSFSINGSSNIKFEKVFLHGSLNGSSHDDFRGLSIRDSNNVSITNSKFAELTDAITHRDSRNVQISNNEFSVIRDNGVAGGGTSHLTITDNFFTNFQNVDWVIHPDAIQVWTTNTKAGATDILISGNTFVRGAGSPIQGIWLRDETGSKPYERVTISDNTIVGASYHGIGIADVRSGLSVTGNTVIAHNDQPSWLRVVNSDNAVVTGNIATDFVFDESVRHSGNVESLAASGDTINATARWLSNNLLSDGLSNGLATVLISELELRGFIDGDASSPLRNLSFSVVAINGTSGADRLSVGNVGSYRLEGFDGNDTLVGGGAGTNQLIGGAGDDAYFVRQVGDSVIELANGGTDTVVTRIDYTLPDHVENGRAEVAGLDLHGNALNNNLQASADGSRLHGVGGDDVIIGAIGNDELHGGVGNDRLTGNDGNDMLFGDDGNDTLSGGAGNDVLTGGSGNDTLEGGIGTDLMRGGAGADTFRFREGDFGSAATGGYDQILDFTRSEGDRISLAMIDANARIAGDQAFQFIGSHNFSKVAGQLRVEVLDSLSYVYGDVNGDGAADFTFIVKSAAPLSAGDFWL